MQPLIYKRNTNMILTHEPETAECYLPTDFGDFRLHVFVNPTDKSENLALVMGEISCDKPVLVRLQSECLTGEVFSSQRCDCRHQLHKSLQIIAAEGSGVLLYMRQEGRGIGITNKVRAYRLQEQGLDTFEANAEMGLPIDARDYGFAGLMLGWLGVNKVRLLTNNPEKVAKLRHCGIKVVERLSIGGGQTPHNLEYLAAKVTRANHDPVLLT